MTDSETCAQRILIDPCEHSASSHCVRCAAALIESLILQAQIERNDAVLAILHTRESRWRIVEYCMRVNTELIKAMTGKAES